MQTPRNIIVKKMSQMQSLPGSTPIIQVMGHQFRKDDECVPFYVAYTWENHYDRGDGYSHYSLKFVQTFHGEFWYSTDKKEFSLVGKPAQWKGTSKIKKFKGSGQVCIHFDGNDKCTDLHHFDHDALLAKKHLTKTSPP